MAFVPGKPALLGLCGNLGTASILTRCKLRLPLRDACLLTRYWSVTGTGMGVSGFLDLTGWDFGNLGLKPNAVLKRVGTQ